MTHSTTLLPLAILVLVAGCQPPTPRSRADAAARAACREEVDRVYSQQNRADLSRRDERDYAFAGSYNSGIVSRGMSSRYGRDQMVTSCVQSTGSPNAQSIDTGVGPTFSPAQR